VEDAGDNITFRVYPSELIDENKWRAVRYGLDGNLIDFGKQRELPARELIRELIDWFIADVVDDWAAGRTSSTRTRSSRRLERRSSDRGV
jgi:carboxylate-amine ligase